MSKWIWALLICVVLLFIVVLSLFFATEPSQEESQDKYVINQIRLSVNPLLLYIEDHFPNLALDSAIRSTLQQMSDDKNIDITVVQLDGTVSYTSIKNDVSTIHIKHDIHYDLFTSQQELGKINIAFPIMNGENNEQIGNAIFSLNKDILFPLKQTNSSSILLLVFISFLSLLIICLALFIVRKVHQDILKPLHELKDNTEEIVKGNYEQITIHSKIDEIGELYAVFDQMRLEIKQLAIQHNEQEQTQKKLISNISHEVRTPLTTIKAYLDAISEGICRDEDSLMAYIQIMQSNTDKMSRLVDDIP